MAARPAKPVARPRPRGGLGSLTAALQSNPGPTEPVKRPKPVVRPGAKAAPAAARRKPPAVKTPPREPLAQFVTEDGEPYTSEELPVVGDTPGAIVRGEPGVHSALAFFDLDEISLAFQAQDYTTKEHVETLIGIIRDGQDDKARLGAARELRQYTESAVKLSAPKTTATLIQQGGDAKPLLVMQHQASILASHLAANHPASLVSTARILEPG